MDGDGKDHVSAWLTRYAARLYGRPRRLDPMDPLEKVISSDCVNQLLGHHVL